MTTERLKEFVILATILNYSKAAEKLFISQPVLSRHIKELEEYFSTNLFVRGSGGVTLTEEGQYLLKWIIPFLEKVERSESAISETPSGGRDRICNVLCSESSLTPRILSFIRFFMESYPDVKLHIQSMTGSSKKDMIYSCDIFITPCDFTQMLQRDTEGSLLTVQQSLLAIPPFHRFGDLSGIKLDDLKDETLIVPYADELFGPYARNALAATRRCHGLLHKVNAEHPMHGLLMVELGLGVMLIPYHLKNRVYSQTRTIPVSDADCVFPIYVYLNHRENNPSAVLFYKEILNKLL